MSCLQAELKLTEEIEAKTKRDVDMVQAWKLCQRSKVIMLSLLTLGVHAQRGLQYLVCLCVCLSVCLSVDAYSGTTGYKAAYELYKRVQIYKGLNITRRFSSNDCVWEIWRENNQYDNEYLLTAVLLQRPLAQCFDDRGF